MFVKISIHALLAESDALAQSVVTFLTGFLSTLSLRRATNQPGDRAVLAEISIHALLAESDLKVIYLYKVGTISIHALLAESDHAGMGNYTNKFISIHALLAESDSDMWRLVTMRLDISIHALLAESDCFSAGDFRTLFISIHALLAESDNMVPPHICNANFDFYPRSPCGERPLGLGQNAAAIDFYPRSPCGERLAVPDLGKGNIRISIHALLAESDSMSGTDFYRSAIISIHALLAESDLP